MQTFSIALRSDVIQELSPATIPRLTNLDSILEALQAICLPHKTNFLIIDQLERGFPMMPDREEHGQFLASNGETCARRHIMSGEGDIGDQYRLDIHVSECANTTRRFDLQLSLSCTNP